jgi:pimeloyl-ACP methyl ester carboxylesterase
VTAYIVCTDDRAVPPALPRAVARRLTTTVEIPTSHSPFLGNPQLFAGTLASFVS